MNLLATESFSSCSSSSVDDDFLIRNILLTHDPDGRHLDSELLLRATENIMCYATTLDVLDQRFDAIGTSNICNIEAIASEEPWGQTIYKMSQEIHCRCYVDGDLHTQAMSLFDMLGPYRWDAKVALVLAAFATSYGEFWLILQLYARDHLAAAVAILKHMPSDISWLKPRFKALNLLVKTMVEVTKCIIKFEGLPLQQVLLDSKAMAVTKSQIYIATYWIFRSSLACCFQITDLMKHEQVYSKSTPIAALELLSLAYKLRGLCRNLREQVDLCHQQIEKGWYKKLLNLFKETHADNQEVLHTLFALKDELPFRNCSSQTKPSCVHVEKGWYKKLLNLFKETHADNQELGISELKSKVVLLLISKPELLSIDGILLLVQQTYDHPDHKNLGGSYEILWVPIPSSDTWNFAEERSFDFYANSLPCLSIRRPWLLNSVVVKFIKEELNYKEEPLMVVWDVRGMVTNSNAIDMMLIWGAKAFPFSASREKKLWETENWTLQFMVDGIDTLLTKWVEEGKNLCIFSSSSLDWIREFSSKVKEIKSTGMQLDMIYVGTRNQSEHVQKILAIIDDEKLGSSLTLIKMNFFWIRLDSMKKSIVRQEQTVHTQRILEEVSEILDSDKIEKDWVVIGRGSATGLVKLQGKKIMEYFDLFPVWGENVGKVGLMAAIRAALEPPLPATRCNYSNVVSYDERLMEGTVVCEQCKRPMEKFVIYE
ncbi:unnamed protein product [Ilex paraguariensis]|uniref:Protein SIEVE ELEMENT OCCLUSION C n=2 Tax=Ilex paraguariensis TaxID=185542 RepID=A0ABC8UHM5_9AQUA